MKKIKYYVSIFVLIVISCFFSACGTANIDYDLSASGNTLTYSTVTNMKKNPKNYINKTFKIRGKIRSNGSKYHYIFGTDPENCCNWDLEIRAESNDFEYPSSSKNVIAVGVYKSSKINGKTSYYLQVSDFD